MFASTVVCVLDEYKHMLMIIIYDNLKNMNKQQIELEVV